MLRLPLTTVLVLAVVAMRLAAPASALAACDDGPRPSVEKIENGPGPLRNDLLKAHNRARAGADLPPLATNLKLERAAQAHARDMAEHGRMTHEGSDGSTPFERIDRQDYQNQSSGENVAAGQANVTDVMQSWIDSPEHKKNILGKYTEMGGAVARGKDGRLYWCVDFGRPWPSLDPDRAAAEVLAAVNQERAKAGLTLLKANPKLQTAALRHARDQAARGQFAPKDDDGLTPFERAAKEGYRFLRAYEASAAGEPTAQDVVASWLKKPNRTENPLGDFRDIGVGFASSTKGKPYWSVLFAAPMP